MKTLLLGLLISVSFAGTSIYDFKVPGLDGEIDFSKYKGKKIMIVNTASKCGNTPQYAELEKLYESHKHLFILRAQRNLNWSFQLSAQSIKAQI